VSRRSSSVAQLRPVEPARKSAIGAELPSASTLDRINNDSPQPLGLIRVERQPL